MTVKNIYDFINTFAPFETAAGWDNPGILCGDENSTVSKVLVCLDVTAEEILQAEKSGAELIISHHPVIFHPQKNFLKGNVCFEAAKRGISIICAHTNLDKATGGVNDVLCRALKMNFIKEAEEIGEGFLNTGYLPEKFSVKDAALFIGRQLNASVRYMNSDAVIGKTAVCSGAGADLAADASKCGCNALITGDASYHDFLNAADCGVTLFATGHFETEIIIVGELIEVLSAKFNDIAFIPSERKNPVITVN